MVKLNLAKVFLVATFVVCSAPSPSSAQSRAVFSDSFTNYEESSVVAASEPSMGEDSPIDYSSVDFEPVGGGLADFTNSTSGGAPCSPPSGKACTLSSECAVACSGITDCGCKYIPPGFFQVYGTCGCGVWITKR